jgi:large subunit ribosomal protein L17
MRHKKKLNHLGRQKGHREAMLANMAASLITHKRITTTTAKAKALKIFVEPLITKAKTDNTHARRHVFSHLQDKEATAELFREVAEKVADRPGGYTRIIKLGNRLGDNADMCIIELVDYNENMLAEKAAAKKSASRRRRGGKKKSEEATAGAAVETAAVAEEAAETAAGEATAEAPAEEASETATEAVKEEEAPEAAAPAEEKKEEETPEAPAAEKKEDAEEEGADDKEKKA